MVGVDGGVQQVSRPDVQLWWEGLGAYWVGFLWGAINQIFGDKVPCTLSDVGYYFFICIFLWQNRLAVNYECHEINQFVSRLHQYNKSLYIVRDYVWQLCSDISQLKNILENIVMHWEPVLGVTHYK